MSSYGDGSIFPNKRKPGTFYATFPLGNGKRSPRFSCKNMTEGRKLWAAYQLEQERFAAQKALLEQKAQVITVEQHIRARWAAIFNNRRRTTQITHNQLLENHVYNDSIFCSLPMNNIKPSDVADFISRIQSSNSMKVRVYKFTRSFWTYLVLEGTIPKNPIYVAELPKVEESKIDAFTHEEQRKILDHVKGSQVWESLLTYMFETGARQSEALGLCHDCVDFKTSKVIIKRTLHADDRHVWLVEGTKSPAGLRSNKVSALTLDLLRGQANAHSAYVFTDTYGNPWNKNALNKLWRRMLVKAGVRHRGMHSIRHSAITRMLKSGIPAITVAKYVGHEKASLVLDTYSSVFEDDLDSVTSSFETFVSQLVSRAVA